ncbi:hypothetical protein BCE75_102438 [Isoptericola sp. CG 20/1183]|uniref:Uncharacterized protein n=1 Tax=Isoptericola halotolerans TaxID=300560 RepID=A0ABX5EJ63_9MICO|nr:MULTISPECIES: hypothetical protein [Isoptericola]MCK0118054.1 hypothetical protein [Isoptericola sp. S6320L]PRZ09724.1 hypothetical protein BCE75_102438 [Isoptericola sp. CG 20/1183]PRZ10525.1 hypothetical protein BCL65_101670 [Isoptericola halotolerans]
MSRQIAGFELRLPDSWWAVPTEAPESVPEWARSTAAALVADVGTSGGHDVAPDELADEIARQLEDVARAVAETGIPGLVTAVLVRRPELGVVDAMVTVTAQQDLAADEFTAGLAAAVEESDEHDYAFAGRFDGTVAAGDVTGLHAMITHFGELGEDGSGTLEERVVLGVFPAGSRDMVEVTAVARSVGTFEDMPQEMLELLEGLSVETETA